MHRVQPNIVRDIERTIAMAAGVAVSIALLLGAVAPAARQPEVRVVPTARCERDEPGASMPVERPAAGAACPADGDAPAHPVHTS